MLFAERVDIVLFLPLEVSYWLRQLDEGFEVEPLLMASDNHSYYLAFSKNISDDIVAQFQLNLDRMKQDGTYEMLLKHYMR